MDGELNIQLDKVFEMIKETFILWRINQFFLSLSTCARNITAFT